MATPSGATAVVRVLPSPVHADRIDMAIERALRKLYSTVTKASSTTWYWSSYNDTIGNAVTGFSTLALASLVAVAGIMAGTALGLRGALRVRPLAAA